MKTKGFQKTGGLEKCGEATFLVRELPFAKRINTKSVIGRLEEIKIRGENSEYFNPC